MLPLLAEAPALPLHEAGKYVAGAYIVFLLLIVIYVAIMATKLQRMERELRGLAAIAERAGGEAGMPARQAEDNGGEGASVSASDDSSARRAEPQHSQLSTGAELDV